MSQEPTVYREFSAPLYLEGYVQRDAYGRVFIDKCPDPEHHLARAIVPPGKERPGCRVYLSDIIPPEYIGKEVTISLDITVTLKETTDA